MDNWSRIGDANWRAEDGAIVADKGGWLFSIEELVQGLSDQGGVLGGSHHEQRNFPARFRPNNIGSKTAYEANIFDQREDPSYGTGAIVNFATVSPMPKARGKWNNFEITAKGSQLLALQYGSGPKGAPRGVIKWRKVQIKPL